MNFLSAVVGAGIRPEADGSEFAHGGPPISIGCGLERAKNLFHRRHDRYSEATRSDR
ncbi:MAG: hypothetical protein GY772_28815 [bacterium]|nr:hypothetical protein [bacterium]